MNLLLKVRSLTLTTILLFFISVITLVQAFIDENNRNVYIVSTIIAHICLIAAGFSCARAISRRENQKFFKLLRDDLYGNRS